MFEGHQWTQHYTKDLIWKGYERATPPWLAHLVVAAVDYRGMHVVVVAGMRWWSEHGGSTYSTPHLGICSFAHGLTGGGLPNSHDHRGQQVVVGRRRRIL